MSGENRAVLTRFAGTEKSHEPQFEGDEALPLVSVIVPCYNTRDVIRQLLVSISQSVYRNVEVIVIDDASLDNGTEIVQSEFPWVRVLVNNENRGKSWSINRGIENASGSLIVITDPDLVLDPLLLSVWVDALNQDSRIGVGGAFVYYQASPLLLTHAGAKIDRRTGRIHHEQVNTPFHHDAEYYDESPDFIFDDIYILRKSAVAAIGGYDYANFRTIYEEADLQMRMANAGAVKAIIPGARAFHAIPVRQWDQMRHYSRYKIELFCRNRLIFLRKFGMLKTNNGTWLLLNMFAYYSFIALIQPVMFPERLSLLRTVARGLSHGLRDPIVPVEPHVPLGLTYVQSPRKDSSLRTNS